MALQTSNSNLHSGVAVVLHDEHGKDVHPKATLLLAQNIANLARQYRVHSEEHHPLSAHVPPGDYSLQVVAQGYRVAKDFVRVPPDHITRHTLHLHREHKPPPMPSVAERLEPYGLSPATAKLSELHVRDREHLSLDYRKYRHPEHFKVLRPESIRDIKRWVGSKPDAFDHDAPRFGPLPAASAARLGQEVSLGQADRDALQALAREYIYGNVRVVAQFEPLLDAYVSRLRDTIFVPIFFYSVITIYNGGTLEIGNGSSVLFCDELRVQTDGVLLIVGDVNVDAGTYTEFA